MANFVLPGDIIGPSDKHHPGPGTHLYPTNVCASLAGTLVKIPATENNTTSQAIVMVQDPSLSSTQSQGSSLKTTSSILPEVDSVVLARVKRITKEAANAGILVVGDQVVGEEWAGVIRVQDVRATEKDRVKIMESFRPGDVIRAIVISLGDQSNYYLSTARNELGVVIATSEVGNQMFPVSWKEFEDSVTGEKEPRKVAKPF
ncbi:MAG: exosome 3'-_5 exonuclease subunit ski4 (Csl4) [Vezdaea aestivalis]|nr:MAG: exosome 3'->5 exonuclease subunit ski4 (Csl4) [Vezdaea aestivalis]